jgi:hypothetical protein
MGDVLLRGGSSTLGASVAETAFRDLAWRAPRLRPALLRASTRVFRASL